jgi:hypothetical protein
MGMFGGGGGAPAITAQPAAPRVPDAIGPTTPVENGSMATTYITNNYGETPDNQGEYVRKEGQAAVPGMGQEEDVALALGGEAETMFTPFSDRRPGASFLGSEYEQAEGLPSMDAVVANQNPNATGEGGPGFGNRIIGGEAGIEAGVMPEGSMEQTDVVGTEMASDVATTNEQPLPGQALNNDVNYRMSAGTGFGSGLGGYNLGYGPQSLRAGNFGRNLLGKREAGFASKYG